jgi:uncharacterized membrane protein
MSSVAAIDESGSATPSKEKPMSIIRKPIDRIDPSSSSALLALMSSAVIVFFFGLMMMRLIGDGIIACLLAGVLFVILFPLVYSLACETQGRVR